MKVEIVSTTGSLFERVKIGQLFKRHDSWFLKVTFGMAIELTETGIIPNIIMNDNATVSCISEIRIIQAKEI